MPESLPSLSRPRLTVVAAVIERAGRILICQRAEGGSNHLKWEFPGGKMEAAESPREALERELREELEIAAEIGPEITRYEFAYIGKAPIQLIFFHVVRFEGEPKNMVFEEIRWEPVSRLPSYDFLAGDVDFVRRIAAGEWPAVGYFPG